MNNAIDLIIGPTFITGVICAVPSFLAARWLIGKRRLLASQWRHNEAATKAAGTQVRSLENAVAATITELESHPATYETFPQDVRELLYQAQENTHRKG